jgi:outer membrane protein TolC
MTRIHTRGAFIAAVGALALTGARLQAQQDTARRSAAAPVAGVRNLSLDEALRIAESQSEVVQIARAGQARASAQVLKARSQFFPQINATGSYSKTLKSQFEGLSFGGGGADTTTQSFPALCAPDLPATATPAERQAALAQARTCPAPGGGVDFSRVGFGAKNQWLFGLQASQNVWTGGRISAQNTAAGAAATAATIEVAAQRAQLALDVTQAYYDATLADRLVSISTTALSQTEEVLRQTQVARQVGNQSEFELLRAQVARDNQVPPLLQARNNQRVTYYRLKQLLNIPLDDSLALSTGLDDSTAVRGAVVSAVSAVSTANPSAVAASFADTNVSDRAPVRQVEQNLKGQQALLSSARAQHWPTIQIVSGYQRLFFPTSTFPQINDYRQNWTVGVQASVPVFAGGAIRSDVRAAEASVQEARARLQQTREIAALDVRVALSQLEQAEATWRASQGTAEQAARAYSIDQIRFREGISTQTDITQSRLQMEQARVNRAIAGRDVAVARVRLALIKDLPLQPGNGTLAGQGVGAGGLLPGGAGGAAGGMGGGGQGGGAAPTQPRTTAQAGSAGSGSF